MPIYKTGKEKVIDGRKLKQYRVFVTRTNEDGVKQRKTKLVYGKDEAQDTEAELLRQLKTADGLQEKLTLQQLYDEYIKSKEHEVRRSSLEKTKSILKNHVLIGSLSNTRIDKLSKRILQSWKDDLAKKDIMISTKNNAIRELNTLLNYAVKMDYISKNPLRDIGKFKDVYFTTNQEKLHYYTKEQFDKYIQIAKESRHNLTDYGCYVFFILAFYTGCRKGELNALKWSDYENDTIHIRRSICQKVKGGYEETPPKNKSSYRDIKIPNIVINILEEYRDILKQKTQYSENMRICGGIKPIPDTVLENHNTAYAEAAGLPHIRIHDFRHSHATFLINKGVNIMEVSRRLGHSDVKMTWNTYAHLYPESEEAALKALES